MAWREQPVFATHLVYKSSQTSSQHSPSSVHLRSLVSLAYRRNSEEKTICVTSRLRTRYESSLKEMSIKASQ